MLALHVINTGTDDKNVASYDYAVMINGRVICRGEVDGHQRTWGWKSLVERILVDAAQRGDIKSLEDSTAYSSSSKRN